MKLIINGEEARIPSGGSSGVTMDQVNSAIDTKLDAYETQEVYSTEEVRIGAWIDGKPLYRKVYQAKTQNAVGTVVIVTWQSLGPLSISYIPNLRAVINYQSDGRHVCLPDGVNADNTYFSIWVDPSGIKCSINAEQYKNRDLTIVLEYTKTTDQAQTTAVNTVLKAPALSSIQSAAVTASTQEVLIDC